MRIICLPANNLTIILIIRKTSLNIIVIIVIIVTVAKRAHTDRTFLHVVCLLPIHNRSRDHPKGQELTNHILHPSHAPGLRSPGVRPCAWKDVAHVVRICAGRLSQNWHQQHKIIKSFWDESFKI